MNDISAPLRPNPRVILFLDFFGRLLVIAGVAAGALMIAHAYHPHDWDQPLLICGVVALVGGPVMGGFVVGLSEALRYLSSISAQNGALLNDSRHILDVLGRNVR